MNLIDYWEILQQPVTCTTQVSCFLWTSSKPCSYIFLHMGQKFNNRRSFQSQTCSQRSLWLEPQLWQWSDVTSHERLIYLIASTSFSNLRYRQCHYHPLQVEKNFKAFDKRTKATPQCMKKHNFKIKNKLPYLSTYKAPSVIRCTLNFWRRLWQVGKMKISGKYTVVWFATQ